MIRSKLDLLEYLEADRIALYRKQKKPSAVDLIWQYERALRKLEYYTNIRAWGGVRLYYKIKHFVLGIILGFDIPINVVDKGLALPHRGTIIISYGAHIGENCRIHVGVNIGTAPGCGGKAPTIGNNVYIAPGAKIYGPITIASGIMIGANAVVGKSFTEDNICIAGVPARKISDMGRFDIEARNHKLYES